MCFWWLITLWSHISHFCGTTYYCTLHFIEEKSKDKAKEEEEISDLDQLLRIERLKEQKRKDEAETLELAEDEAQVSWCFVVGFVLFMEMFITMEKRLTNCVFNIHTGWYRTWQVKTI